MVAVGATNAPEAPAKADAEGSGAVAAGADAPASAEASNATSTAPVPADAIVADRAVGGDASGATNAPEAPTPADAVGADGPVTPTAVGVGHAGGTTNAPEAPTRADAVGRRTGTAKPDAVDAHAGTAKPDAVGDTGGTTSVPEAPDPVGGGSAGAGAAEAEAAASANAGAPTAPPTRRLFWSTIAVGIVLLVVDQASKWWAVRALGDSESIDVVGDVIRFWLVYNPGAAFSMGTGVTWVFTIFAGVAGVAIAWYAWRVRSTPWAYALGLLLGGATSHFGDRLFREPGFARGHVVDFIDYAGFFVGNVADIGIFAGAVTIVVLSFKGIEAVDREPADTRTD